MDTSATPNTDAMMEDSPPPPQENEAKTNTGEDSQEPPKETTVEPAQPTTENKQTKPQETIPKTKTELPLILTSDKRQGIYECDYCGIDITRLPRIRCNECDDFDLCMDCFTKDPASSLARWKAVHGDAKLEHDPKTHGYRVCDSTRFPLFDTTSTPTSTSKKRKQAPDDVGVTDRNSNDGGATASEASDSGALETVNNETTETGVIVVDDARNYWTAEEDLRLLRGIEIHGLGNWTEIAEAVAGPGSVGKNARKCMERYFDDYMGRFGCIFPPTTLIEYVEAAAPAAASASSSQEDAASTSAAAAMETEEATRSSKRRSVLRSPSTLSSMAVPKKYKVVPTESLPEFQALAYEPYLPKLANGTPALGQAVGRDQASKAEQAYVRAVANLDKTKLEEVRKEWEAKVNQPGGPSVLPMRVEDVPKLPGAELAGFMPRRGDFDVEWAESAEETIADLEFFPGENEQDRNLKLKVLQVYNTKLDEREERKQFVLSRKLYDYRARQAELEKLPQDERDLVQRLRLIERFHTPEEHKKFIDDLLKAKRLRKEIAKFQMYRRMGIRTLEDVERFELDMNRRMHHKAVIQQKEADKKSSSTPSAPADAGEKLGTDSDHSNYWKQYRTQDRKNRRSINRQPSMTDSSEKAPLQAPDSPSRRHSLGAKAVEYLKAWLLSPEHIQNPYPTEEQKNQIMADTGIDMKQLTNWFVNNRKRIWKPHVEGTERAVAAVEAATTATLELQESSEKDNDDATKPAAAETPKQVATPTTDPNPSTPSPSPEPMDVEESCASKEKGSQDPMTYLPGFNLLSSSEVELCKTVQLDPQPYLEIKKALIYESLQEGMLDSVDKRTRVAGQFRRTSTLFQLDVTRRGQVIDFVIRSGWISSGFGSTVRAAP